MKSFQICLFSEQINHIHMSPVTPANTFDILTVRIYASENGVWSYFRESMGNGQELGGGDCAVFIGVIGVEITWKGDLLL